MNSPAVRFYEFGDFRLDANGRLLLRGGEIVDITPKALDILLVLVEAGGNVVSKEELLKRVWADRFVEEANLSYNVFKLRKALSDGENSRFIETLPKRGYRFVGEIRKSVTADGLPDLRASDRVQLPESESPLQPEPRGYRSTWHRWMIAAVSGLVIVALGAAGYLAIRALRLRPAVANSSEPLPPMSVLPVTNSGTTASAAISPDGKFLVYTQNAEIGDGSMRIRQTGTSTEATLLEPGERVFGSITFSPDSQRIYYLVNSDQDSKWILYRLPILGGEPTRLLVIDDNMFTLSPDEKTVVYYRFELEAKRTEIIASAIDGSGERSVLSQAHDEMLFTGVPSWSPDGTQIAFAADNGPPINGSEPHKYGIFTIELGSGRIAALSTETWRGVGLIGWMKDNTGVVLAGSRPPSGNQLYFLSLPGGKVQQLTKEFGIYSNFAVAVTSDGSMLVGERLESVSHLWTVDANGDKHTAVQLTTGEFDGLRGLAVLSGGEIVYSTQAGPDYDLWIMSEKDGKREGKPLTSDAYSDTEPAASPDGKTIVFVSDRAGGHHLFRIDRDGTNLKQLTGGGGADSSPDFAPDGKWIVFASSNGESSRIWKIAVDGGDAIRVNDFEAVAPSYSPDGRSIACVVPLDNQVKPSTLAVISSDDGKILKQFAVLPFEWFYRKPLWSRRGDALIYDGNDNYLQNLWRQDLAGGAPVQLTNFSDAQTLYFAFSADAKHLITSRVVYKDNVVILRNFRPA